MKVWEEGEVLKELIASRTIAAIVDREEEIKSSNLNTKHVSHKSISFLLVLARKCERKQYEFVYYPSETYERIEQVFTATAVVLDDGTVTEIGSDMDDEGNDRMVWNVSPSSSSSDEEEDERRTPCFESYYVGKAIFHTLSGDPLRRIEGSPGWREALKQKYYSLDSKSHATVNKVLADKKGNTGRSNVAVKAVAAAAIGGGAATGGTSLVAGALGYTASGIAASSPAAAIMSMEAIASGGGVVAGGFTATMQTIGTVGVMASPVGMTLAAGGAMVGVASYYWINRRNRRKQEEQERKAKEIALMEALNRQENAGEEALTKPVNDYVPLRDDDTDHQQDEIDLWVMVAAKRIAAEETEHCFDHSCWEEQVEAEKSFQEVSCSTAAKALFDPQGVLVQLDADPADKDGWEMALRLHYDSMVENDMIPTAQKKHGEAATEGTPLLTVED
jgi:Interferon-induced 6-16 family